MQKLSFSLLYRGSALAELSVEESNDSWLIHIFYSKKFLTYDVRKILAQRKHWFEEGTYQRGLGLSECRCTD